MKDEWPESWSRREFLGKLLLAGTAGVVALRSGRLAAELLGTQRALAAEPPPETMTIRLAQTPAICAAPLLVAEEFLWAEGFKDVQYVKASLGTPHYTALASGEFDLTMVVSGLLLFPLDKGDPIVVLAGIHIGCFELFGTDRVRAIRDLKGKIVAVPALGSGAHVFLASMAAYVGLDPRRDINWVAHPFAETRRLLAEGKIDAYLAFPPEPQELRAKKIGHVVVNTMIDRPWSEYFCCMLAANRAFVQRHPVATKRALRAILKAASACAREPERVARLLVAKGYTPNYAYALEALKDIPYDHWREYDAENTLRFYGLRLYEAGMIKSNPQKLVAQGTDWRFLNQIKRELKGSSLDPQNHLGHFGHLHLGG